MKTPRYIISIDAEATSLHGSVFAIGAVVLETASGCWLDKCLWLTRNHPHVNSFVEMHVLPALEKETATHSNMALMRDDFWRWLKSKIALSGSIVVADCGWPVEANLLSACVADSPDDEMDGPYPLHEVATLLLAADLDPKGDYWHLMSPEKRLRKHHPTIDAEQSARIAMMAIERINGKS